MKKCKHCKQEIDDKAKVCHHCGKKQRSVGKIILFVILGFFVVGILGSCLGGGGSSSDKAPVEKGHFESQLGAGVYTTGIDFPAGTYTLTAVSGQGNVSSSNMFSGGLNELMGVDTSDGFYVDTFSNAKFENGNTLKISGNVVIALISEDATINDIKARENTATEVVTLGSGNYIAGTDFPAGIYTITSAGGAGNVSSSNMYDGGLNEIIGDVNDGFSTLEFKNAKFDQGMELSVSGVTIVLTPSN